MTRIINSVRESDQYINLLKAVNEPIPEDLLSDIKRAIYSTTYGLKLRFMVRVEEELPEYLEYFIRCD